GYARADVGNQCVSRSAGAECRGRHDRYASDAELDATDLDEERAQFDAEPAGIELCHSERSVADHERANSRFEHVCQGLLCGGSGHADSEFCAELKPGVAGGDSRKFECADRLGGYAKVSERDV